MACTHDEGVDCMTCARQRLRPPPLPRFSDVPLGPPPPPPYAPPGWGETAGQAVPEPQYFPPLPVAPVRPRHLAVLLAAVAFLCGFLLGGVAWGAPRGPYVASDTKGEEGRVLVVKNPGLKPTLVTVGCAAVPSLTEQAVVWPRQQVTFEFRYSGSKAHLKKGSCGILALAPWRASWGRGP